MSAAEATIPLFPLGTVLVPGLLLPLHVFEPRYRELVAGIIEADRAAADRGDPDETVRGFGVPAIRQGWEVGSAGVQALHPVGTFARVTQVAPYDDGRYDILTVGTRRFELVDVDATSRSYLTATVTWLPEDEGDAASVLAPSVARRFTAYRRAIAGAGAAEADDVEAVLEAPWADLSDDPRGEQDDDDALPEDPTRLSYVVTAAMVLDVADRQRLLAAADTTERLRQALGLLRRETRILRTLPSLPAVSLTRAVWSPN